MIEIIDRRIARQKQDLREARAAEEDTTPILAVLVELMDLREEVGREGPRIRTAPKEEVAAP